MDRLGEDPKAEQLREAAKEGDMATVKSLLDAGADVNAKNRLSETPLYYASWRGHADIVRLLLERGADVNAKNASGWTPLHWACRQGHIEILKLLLEYDKDRISVNTRTGLDGTPLHFACWFSQVGEVRPLLEAGADMGIADSDGRSPAFTVIKKSLHPPSRDAAERILDLLIEYNAMAVFETILALPEKFNEERERLLEWYRENKPDLYFEKWCQTPMGPG